MKKIFLVLVVIFLFMCRIEAYEIVDQKSVTFDKALTYDVNNSEKFDAVDATSDGGYIVAGGLNDTLVIKYDKNDNVEWSKLFGGSKVDYLHDIEEVDDGYVAVGYTYSTDILNLNVSSQDALIIKYDKKGNIIWYKNLSESNDQVFRDVEVLKDGSYLVVGYSNSYNKLGYSNSSDYGNCISGSHGIIIKYDKDGNVIFQDIYGEVGICGQDFKYYGLTLTKDGGFLALGGGYHSNETNYSISLVENKTGYINKYDSDGKLVWSQVTKKDSVPFNNSVSTVNNSYGSLNKIDLGLLLNEPDLGLQDAVELENGDIFVVGRIFQGDFANGSGYSSFKALYNKDGDFISYIFGCNDYSDLNTGVVYDDQSKLITVSGFCSGDSEQISYSLNYKGRIEHKFGQLFSNSESTDIDILNNGEYIFVGNSKKNKVQFNDNILESNTNENGFVHRYYNLYQLNLRQISSLEQNVALDDIELERNGTKVIANVPRKSGKKNVLVLRDFSGHIQELTDNGDGTYEFEFNDNRIIELGQVEAVIEKSSVVEEPEIYEVEKLDDGRGKITLNLSEGYQLKKLSIVDTLGNEVEYTKESDGYYVYLYDNVTVSVIQEKIPNPKTSDSIIGSCVLFVLSLVLFSFNYWIYRKNSFSL